MSPRLSLLIALVTGPTARVVWISDLFRGSAQIEIGTSPTPKTYNILNCPGANFLGDINCYRAPGDAAATPDATGGAKLVDPGRQFVCHPLMIARFCGSTDAAAHNVGKINLEAGVPLAPPLGVFTGKIGGVLDRRAKAGGADHGAIGAGQTTRRDVVPKTKHWRVEPPI
jgi:hypothetical protein